MQLSYYENIWICHVVQFYHAKKIFEIGYLNSNLEFGISTFVAMETNVCCMQQEVPWTPVSCVPLSFIGDRLGLGSGLTRVNFSLVTAKKPQNNKRLLHSNHLNKSVIQILHKKHYKN